MSSVTIQLPEPVLYRLNRGAAAAGKALEDFVVERLVAMPLPLAEDLPTELRAELAPLEHLDDAALWRMATEQLSPADQAEYDGLLDKSQATALTRTEQGRLEAHGARARRLTLRRSHAYMLLKWRGHPLPTADELANCS